MADRIKVDVPGYVGDFEWDMDARPLTGMELRFIRQISGVRLGEISKELSRGNWELVVSLAVCAMYRAGKVSRDQVEMVADMILEAPAGTSIDYIVGEESQAAAEAEAKLDPPSGPAGVVELSQRSPSSSESSAISSEPSPESGPPSTGRPASDTGAVSA